MALANAFATDARKPRAPDRGTWRLSSRRVPAHSKIPGRRTGKQAGWANFVFSFDEFEELFTLVDKITGALLLNFSTAAAKKPRVRTVVTMRADFYHRCLGWPWSTAYLRKASTRSWRPKPGLLHGMIVRPAERARAQFEKGLAQRILDDNGDERGALPLMAFALSELWKATRTDRVLAHAAYDSFHRSSRRHRQAGGGNLRRKAKALRVKEAELEACLSGFPGADRGGQTRAGDPEAGSVEPSGRWADGRGSGESADRCTAPGHWPRGKEVPMVEVAHEAIFTKWPRLTKWIDSHAGELRICRRLIRAALDWKEAGAPRFQASAGSGHE